MLDKKIIKLINEQVTKEFFSAYLYLDFANYYADEELQGFANWFNIQAQEERDHALLFIKYLQENSERVVLEAIDKPDKEYTCHKTPLDMALEHEKFVTASIHNIYDAAYEIKDFRTMQFLDWFVKEQMEEESNAEALIKKYELFGKDAQGLYLLDTERGTRVYAAPDLTF